MKTNIRILTLAAALCVGLFTASAADNHEHKAAPKGGRLLPNTEPQAEFVVEKDRHVTFNFYSPTMKPVAASTQHVTLIVNAKDGRTTLEFEKKGDSLVSKTTLPEGEGHGVVVQFKQTADARPLNLRFKLDLHICGGCKLAEYACTCDH